MGICVQKAAYRFLLKSRLPNCENKIPKLNPAATERSETRRFSRRLDRSVKNHTVQSQNILFSKKLDGTV